MSDDDLAAALATKAGQLLLDVRVELADAPAAQRKAAGDKRSHDFLMEALAAERPDDAVLSEEGADDPIRLRSRRVWIVDPLDGTREFSELDRDDWAVHVALWQDGELIAGVQHDLAGGGVDAALEAGGPSQRSWSGLAPLDVEVDDALTHAERLLLAGRAGERRVAMLGARLTREEHELLVTHAVRVDVDDEFESDILEVAEAEIRHLMAALAD